MYPLEKAEPGYKNPTLVANNYAVANASTVGRQGQAVVVGIFIALCFRQMVGIFILPPLCYTPV